VTTKAAAGRERAASYHELAASCYERAGFPARAASCLDAAGRPGAAASLFEQAGDLRAAARCYEKAQQLHDAERCLLALDLPDEAAGGWERSGDLFRAAFVLAVRSNRTAHARWLATQAATRGLDGAAARLRRAELRALIALCDIRTPQGPAALVREVASLERLLPGLSPDERMQCETFTVAVADAGGRHDLAARMLAASYLAETPGALTRWRAWGARVLGGTLGIPEPRAATAREGG
jgi:tetratricopeptide (TPR) repeat protein